MGWKIILILILIFIIYYLYELYNSKPKSKVAIINIDNSRLGNRLFIYWSAKLVSHIYGHEFVGEDTSILKDPIYIDDNNYNDIFISKKHDIKERDVIMKGWFQDLDIFGNYYRNIIKAIMSSNNGDKIYYKDILAKDFSKKSCPKLKIYPNEKDLVIHIRLDDFIHEGYNSNIIDINFYKKVIDCKSWDRVIIVTDILNRDFEYKYIKELMRWIKCKVIIHSGSILEDWHLLRSATNLIVSNSTFSWSALVCGDAKWVIIPNTKFYDHQKIVSIKDIKYCEIIDVNRMI